MTQPHRPARDLSLKLCQDMETELAAMRGETDPIKLRLSAERARCWQAMALTVTRLAPITDDTESFAEIQARRQASQPAEPTDAEIEARLTGLMDELDRRKPEIDALMELKAMGAQPPQNRHERRAMEASAGMR